MNIMITFKEGAFEVTCANLAVETARAGIDAAADAIIAADDAKAAERLNA